MPVWFSRRAGATDSVWRNRDTFITGRAGIIEFLTAWWRSYGNELWEFNFRGLMRRREASINDVAIEASQRRIFGPRPAAERGQEFPLR